MSTLNRKSFSVRWGRLINYQETLTKTINIDKNGEQNEVEFLFRSMTMEFTIFSKNKLINTYHIQITNNRKEDRKLCGLDMQVASKDIMHYEKIKKSFDLMWNRVKTFWEITPGEDCGVAYIEKNDDNTNSFILRGFFEAETVFDPALHRFGQAVGVKWSGASEIGNIFKVIGFIAEHCENNNKITQDFIEIVKNNTRLKLKNDSLLQENLKDNLENIVDSLQMTEIAKTKTLEFAKQILKDDEFNKCFSNGNEKGLLYRFVSILIDCIEKAKKKIENDNLSNQ